MKNHRVTLRVELEPSGSASIDTVEIRASIDWMNAGVYAQVEEDPKNLAFGNVPGNARPTVENALISDLSYLLLAKAVSEDITVPDDIAKDVGKFFSQFQEVFTGENILFLVQFSRLFDETVTAAETYLSKDIYKPQTETAILSELVGILLDKPLPTEFVTMEDLMGFLHERDWYEYVYTERTDDVVNALPFNSAIINNGVGGDLLSWQVDKPIESSISQPDDLYDRIVLFVRDYYSSILMVDNADFDNGDGLEYAFAKTLTDTPTVIENIVVGLLYEKAYLETVNMEIKGDVLNDGLLGQYAVNASIGGEFVEIEFLKTLASSLDPMDVYDRVVQFYREYASSVTMVDTADFNSGDGLEYSFLKSLYDSPTVEEQIIVGLLYDKTYYDTIYTNVRGDILNETLLGQYAINQTIGGEFLSLGFIKYLENSVNATDAYDRVIQWQRSYTSSNVTMVDTADFNSGDGLEYQFNKGLLDQPVVTDVISAGLALIREYSDTINVNPENVPINAHVINLLMLNDSPGGDRFSYLMKSAILSETLNGPVINTNVMNGNFTP
jgi:hypothetical protein